MGGTDVPGARPPLRAGRGRRARTGHHRAVLRRGRRRPGLAAGRRARRAPTSRPACSPPSNRGSRCGWPSGPAAPASATTRAGNTTHGVDALRSLALRMTVDRDARWPDLVLFLGDQVYADETTEEMQKFIKERRDIDEPPGKELKDYEEYSHLYALAWSDPLNRWLLSTLPSSMIFDDHDVRDDWNTSYAWKQEIEKTSWWHERIVSGLVSYWVHQHLGNLSPDERAADDIWQLVARHDGRRRGRPDPAAARPGRARRPAPGDLPVELLPRHLRQPAGRRRLARRARARARPAGPARRRRARLARRADARGREAPVHRHVPALPAATGPALPRGVERGGRQRRLGQEVREARRDAAPSRGPRALGGVPAGLPGRGEDGHGGRGRQAGPGARHRHLPVR